MDYFFILKRSFSIILIIGLIYLACKLSIFYIPFIVAYIIFLIVDPIIKWINKKMNISRKVSSIIVLATIFLVLIGIVIWGRSKTYFRNY